MSISSAYPSQPLPARQTASQERQATGGETVAYNLRDTLRNITVREANFSEFLAALKRDLVQAGK